MKQKRANKQERPLSTDYSQDTRHEHFTSVHTQPACSMCVCTVSTPRHSHSPERDQNYRARNEGISARGRDPYRKPLS